METNRVYNTKGKNREMSKFFYLVGIVVIMMSCGKDIDLFIPRAEQGVLGNLSRLSDRLAQDISADISYTIQVPCTGNKAFEVDKDVVIIVPPDFVDLNTYPCSNGYFDILVTVCDKKGEILIAGIPTISEGKLLESRVEINLQIKNGPTHLKLAHGKQISIKVNDPDPRDRMELFYGNDDNSEWIQADGNPDIWSNVENGEWFIQDSLTISGIGYECLSDSMDWINVDVFFEIPENQRTTVCVELPKEFTNTNTAVYVVFNDYNSLINLPGNAANFNFCESYGATPIGFNVTFIVISEMGEDRYFFQAKNTVITSDHVEYLTPVQTPYEEIKNYIISL